MTIICPQCQAVNAVARLFYQSHLDRHGNVWWGYDKVECYHCEKMIEVQPIEYEVDSATE